ncbi:MAG TPA: cytochrome c oxidase subunit I [Vicinamibacterales bacterium]|nr:cytochrome c oxidase subunit I [Vicinamibacterales bacterium]
MTADHEVDARLTPEALAAESRHLAKCWGEERGILAWFSTVDHKRLGLRFIVTAFVWFAFAGVLAALMRLQLARPNNDVLGPDLYNQVFTTHGTAMMFLFAVPVVLGFGVYFVPLMVGARTIAFGRLLAFSYWLFLFAGIFLYGMFLLNIGPDRGWFSYVPLAGPEYGVGHRPDVWAQLVTFTETSALGVAICLITTIFKLRAPGMSLNRMPLFVWTELVTSFMIVFAMPSVFMASATLVLDRLVGTQFYNHAEGGDALLWQHLFWFFAHPEVYVIFLPATGIISTVLPTFARRPVFGYLAIVLAVISTGFIGFGVWVHHMFATGLPQFSISFFTTASLMIVVPTGVQVFCWIATLWSGRVSFPAAMLFVLGWFQVFIIGGLTGVMLASVPLDLQLHDTFFVVAHLHYVLIGGTLFPLLGGIYYWFPKMTGRLLDERLGKTSFWILIAGFNMTFFPQHILGVMGMTRRMYTYPPELDWGPLNMLSSAGAVLIALSLALFLFNVVTSLRRGAAAGDNPWGASTLEWATTSPPADYNFLPWPTVSGRDPLWERFPEQPVVAGLSHEKREVLVTHVMDAEPDHRKEFPGPSLWPFLAAVAVSGLFIGSILTPWAVVVGSLPTTIALIAWFWPRSGKPPDELSREIEESDKAGKEAA